LKKKHRSFEIFLLFVIVSGIGVKMDFVTVEEVKTYLGITGSGEDDTLDVVIAATNAFIPQYTNRVWDLTTYTEELYDGPGHAALHLKHYPIVSISEILVDTIEVEERSDVDETGYYIKDYNTGIVYNNNLWNRGRGNIQVSYVAGYETSDDLPSDLKYACYELASYFRNLRGKSGIASEALGSYSYSLINNPSSGMYIPSITISLILDRYKEITVPWDCF
jgi:uncharacterized phiE125 gp8 family phage protein